MALYMPMFHLLLPFGNCKAKVSRIGIIPTSAPPTSN